MKRLVIFISGMILLLSAWAPKSYAFSLKLDSVATWGKFPRFCVNVYRWGDKFFNSYDSTYVVGTGKKFNVRLKSESWLDYYMFDLSNGSKIRMVSNPSTSLGASLTYLAVSAGYDVNISNWFNEKEDVRKKLNFGFNCALFAADFSYSNNDVSTKIKKFGPKKENNNLNLLFQGINAESYNLDVYYFFNHKRYSQGASFNFSKFQRRSAGSMIAGVAISLQNVDFDFETLPSELKKYLPDNWPSYHYKLKSNNYTVMVGYGYNWVLGRHWLIAGTIAPAFGFRYGFENYPEKSRYGFSLLGRAKMSVVYNHKDYFIGLIGRGNLNLYADKNYVFANSIMSLDAAMGFRFNLW